MRKIAQPVTYETASRLLKYDPATGDLTWREDNRRVKAGDPAGGLTPDGYISVTVGGAKIRGHYLAWLLHYGEWPRGPLRMKSAIGIDPSDDRQLAARQDIRIDNIVEADTVLSDKPAAVRYRQYAGERRRVREIYARDLANRTPTNHYNVEFDTAIDGWIVKELFSVEEERHPLYQQRYQSAKVLSTHSDLHTAERAAEELFANRAFLTDDRGHDKTPAPLPPGVGQITAGPLGPDLADLHARLAYAPNSGHLIWRTGPKRYQDAAVPTTGRTSYVPYLTWRLPAHSLAFFLAYGVWPLRGTIWPFDNNWRNIRLANLMYKHHALTTYPLEPPQ